jgi:hypothetical protein
MFIYSAKCHEYFKDKVVQLLNKQEKPQFIEDFKISESLSFYLIGFI